MTKGKWQFRNVEGNHENIVIYTLKNPHGILNIYPGPDVVSNAQAISAVPDLIDCLKRVMVIWNREGIGTDENESEPLYNDIKSALAKAGQEVGR